MKRYAFLFILSLIPLFTGYTAPVGTYGRIDIDEGASHAEIHVVKGERFVVRLRGKGWYLARYDSGTLGFSSRALEEDHTDFVINPFGKGTGYLFFSRQREDVYILVHIESEGSFPALSYALEEGPVTSPPSAPRGKRLSALKEPQALVEPQVLHEQQVLQELPEQEVTSVPKEPSVPPVPPVPEISPVQEAQLGPSSVKKTPAESEPISKLTEQSRKGSEEGMYYTDQANRVVEVPYKNEEDNYRRGSQFYKKNQYAKAFGEYLAYLTECDKCAHHDEVNYRIAEIYVKEGKDGEALGYLEKLINAKPGDWKSGDFQSQGFQSPNFQLKAYLLRADIDLRSGNVKRAIDGYSAAWNMDSGNNELPRKIGDLYYAAKDYDRALPLYEKSIENGTADDEVYFRAAFIYDSAGKTRNLEKAFKYYKVIVDRYKNSSHKEDAKKRVQFFEKNFYNYK